MFIEIDVDRVYKEAFVVNSMTSLRNKYGYSYGQAKKFLELLEKSDKQKYDELMRLWEERTKVIRSQKAKINAIDESVFDNFSQEMAYWIGMIASDGCVNKRTNKISINCKAEDSSHLIAFKNFLRYSGDVKYRDAKIRDKTYPSAYIDIHSLHIKQRLLGYGIVPAKSNIDIDYLEYIPDEFKIAFICGYFDGDGSINSNIANMGISILGNKSFCESVVSTLLKYEIIAHVNSSRNKFEIRIGSNDSLLRFCEVYLSFDKKYLLARKVRLAEMYVEDLCNNSKHKRSWLNKQRQLNNNTDVAMLHDNTARINKNGYIATYYKCPQCGQWTRSKKTGLCRKCFILKGRESWPTKEELANLICKYPILQIAKQFDVTGNSVRKWCKVYGLPFKMNDIKEFKKTKV